MNSISRMPPLPELHVALELAGFNDLVLDPVLHGGHFLQENSRLGTVDSETAAPFPGTQPRGSHRRRLPRALMSIILSQLCPQAA
jgi:hypothetical protein